MPPELYITLNYYDSFTKNPSQKTPLTATESYPLCFAAQHKLLQLLEICVTSDAGCDIKATCTPSNLPVPQLHWHQPKTSIPSLHGKKKITEPRYGQVLPLLPERLFFSLECGSKLLSQPLQRATTGPRSLGTAEGVEPGGRGAYVTQHAQEASRWEKKMHREKTERRRERGRGVCIWKVLSASRQEPLLCESDKWRKSTTAEAKNCHVFYQTWRLRECV